MQLPCCVNCLIIYVNLRKMFTNLIKLHNDAYLKKVQIVTHNNKSEINNTFLFSHEMSIALILRPLNFCLLMQHTRPCYIVGHGGYNAYCFGKHPGVPGKHLVVQLLWETVPLLVTRVDLIYLYLLMQLSGIRTLDESKVLFFSFWC